MNKHSLCKSYSKIVFKNCSNVARTLSVWMIINSKRNCNFIKFLRPLSQISGSRMAWRRKKCSSVLAPSGAPTSYLPLDSMGHTPQSQGLGFTMGSWPLPKFANSSAMGLRWIMWGRRKCPTPTRHSTGSPTRMSKVWPSKWGGSCRRVSSAWWPPAWTRTTGAASVEKTDWLFPYIGLLIAYCAWMHFSIRWN